VQGILTFGCFTKQLAWGPIKSLQVSLAEVKAAVADSDKQRFALKPRPGAAVDEGEGEASDFMIRANQGHSIKLESAAHLEALSLEAGNIPPRIIHGTYFAFWPAIVAAGGLRTMGRNHVHFATGTGLEVGEEGEEGSANSSNKVISGMRRDAELLVEVDVARSIAEGGLSWWRSDNGVVLCEGDQTGLISSRFFRRVTGRRQDVGVLWEEGEWVADLPKGIKAVVPPGKTPRGERGGGRGRGRGRGA
jgi:2'-phosphotransferase